YILWYSTPAKLDFDVKQLALNFRRLENFLVGVNNWIHADHEFRRVAVSCTAPARHGCLKVVENNYCASKREINPVGCVLRYAFDPVSVAPWIRFTRLDTCLR
ncbi:hypothetical protein Tco_1464287, partial [Tanacetum coccineum]